MADVIVISNSIVRPESNYDEPDRVKIHLTPWDLFFLRSEYPQRSLLYPQPNLETKLIVSQLKSSLSVALKIFYPFAGRLVKIENEDETASCFIDCDGSGVKFVHASAKSVSVSDIIEPLDGKVPDFLSCFFPANGVKSCEGVSESLIAFQLTELKDGIFIGFGYNHMVADGSSFWNFLNTWSEICSTGDDREIFSPLLLRGWFLDGIDYPIRVPISETETLTLVVPSSQPDLQEKIFRFTRRNISELKSKANGDVSPDDRKISSLQAISAHMWRSIIRNSDLKPEEVTHCKLLMDMRRRLDPSLGKECFGNVVGFATATTTAGEILNNGLGWAALQINKSVGSQTNEELRVFAENWVKNPKIRGGHGPDIRFFHWIRIRIRIRRIRNFIIRIRIRAPRIPEFSERIGSDNGSDLGSRIICPPLPKIPKVVAVSNSIIVASSPWFNVYGNDFGWGKPIAIRAGPGNTCDGKLIVYPGIEEGNIEIQTCLSSRVFDKLSIDAEFLKHACVV